MNNNGKIIFANNDVPLIILEGARIVFTDIVKSTNPEYVAQMFIHIIENNFYYDVSEATWKLRGIPLRVSTEKSPPGSPLN